MHGPTEIHLEWKLLPRLRVTKACNTEIQGMTAIKVLSFISKKNVNPGFEKGQPSQIFMKTTNIGTENPNPQTTRPEVSKEKNN